MRLVEFGPDDVTSRTAYVAMAGECDAVDRPWERPRTVYRHEMAQRHGWDGEVSRYFLLRDDGADVGILELFASGYDNLDLAWIELAVRPDLRRRGYGRAALELTTAECLRSGRPLITLYGPESEAARAFARSAGFAASSVEALRQLDLDGSPAERERFRTLYVDAAARAGDYVLERIVGRTDESVLPAIIAVTAAINDAPLDDLVYEDEVYDVDRVRAYEIAQELSGFRFYRLLARHRKSGDVVGHTVVSVDAEQPAWGEQHDTAVVPAHRGHRLGLLLKAGMLIWLAEVEPGLRHVQTGNAVSNDPMIGVNERLGMRLAGRQLLFQRRWVH